MKIFSFSIFLLIAFGCLGFASDIENYLPERVDVIQPDCEDCKRSISLDAPAERDRVHTQGKYWDEYTYRELKAFAALDPAAPAGIEIPFVEETLLQPMAPPLGFSFDGINQNQSRYYPPDTQLAVGPNHILQGTNGALRLSSKTNGQAILLTPEEHFGRPGKFIFDPKVYFDPFSQRFFIVILELSRSPQLSLVRVSVSRSSSPTSLRDGWCRYSINVRSSGSWGDFPSLGMNEKWMAITTNNFGFADNRFKKSLIKVADKAKLANNAGSCPALKVFSYSNTSSFTIQAAYHYTPTGLPGNPLYMVNTFPGTGSIYEFWRVQGTSKPSLTRFTLPAQTYTLPPTARHKSTGTNYDTDIDRVYQNVFRNGVLTFSFTTGCEFGAPPNESCVRVAQIKPTDFSASVTYEATFGGGVDRFFWMPALAVNRNNDMLLVFQQSTPKQFLGTAYTGKKSAATQFEPFRVLKAGGCNLDHTSSSDTRNRNGDYTGIHIDPSDDSTFWFSAEYAKKSGSKCIWATRVGRSRF